MQRAAALSLLLGVCHSQALTASNWTAPSTQPVAVSAGLSPPPGHSTIYPAWVQQRSSAAARAQIDTVRALGQFANAAPVKPPLQNPCDVVSLLPAPVLFIGLPGSGAVHLFNLLAVSGLVIRPPHARGGGPLAFNTANLPGMARVAAFHTRAAFNYTIDALPATLQLELRTAACTFLASQGVFTAATIAAASGCAWAWHAPATAQLLPVFLPLLPGLRVVLVTSRGASPAWASDNVALCAWLHAHLGQPAFIHARLEDIASVGKPFDVRAAALRAVLSWLGWTAPASPSAERYYLARMLGVAARWDLGPAEAAAEAPVAVAAALLALGYPLLPPPPPPAWAPLVAQAELLQPAARARAASVMAGAVPRSELEVVLARYKEDIAWTAPLASVTTVYNLGRPLGLAAPNGTVVRPRRNFGRENAVYLGHIVENWDRLANLTVFSHAGILSGGLRTNAAGTSGGHMVAGTTFWDYLTDARFFLTTALHIGSTARVRSRTIEGYGHPKAPNVNLAPEPPTPRPQCFDPVAVRTFPSAPIFHSHVLRRCKADKERVCSLRAFWDIYVSLRRPEGGVVFFAQGARFSVTREQLMRRPKAQYEAMLATVATSTDPAAGYFLEAFWYYVLTSPHQQPCPLPQELQ